MSVIAVVNRKGGSGKSTLAAHIAAWCALQGEPVMLGDFDRQQSSRAWLRRRPAGLHTIAPWAMGDLGVARVPPGVRHVVLDTPGGLQGFDLARVVMVADAILMPVGTSAFDRESAAACQTELKGLPRVASGRCRLAAIGMRIDRRTRAAESLQAWAAEQGLTFLGALRETQAYVRNLDAGLTLFDLPERDVPAIDLEQWQPILDWLAPLVRPPAAAASVDKLEETAAPRMAGPRAQPLMPAQESLACGARLSTFASGARPAPIAVARPSLPHGVRNLSGGEIPPFLRRQGQP
jgi:chromosome partitioning protein